MTKEDLKIIQIEIDKAIAELYFKLTYRASSPEQRQKAYEELTSGQWRKQ